MNSYSMSKVNPFDDTPYLERLQGFKAYLITVQANHEAYMLGIRAVLASHKDALHKDDKPTRKVKQMTFVYLLPPGASREPVTISTRHVAAPLWAIMNAA